MTADTMRRALLEEARATLVVLSNGQPQTNIDYVAALVTKIDRVLSTPDPRAPAGEGELRAALEPFAQVGQWIDEIHDNVPDDEPVENWVHRNKQPTVGELRRAASALDAPRVGVRDPHDHATLTETMACEVCELGADEPEATPTSSIIEGAKQLREIYPARPPAPDAVEVLESTAKYLDELQANLQRNDADMMIDTCKAPEIVAEELRALAAALREVGQ